MDEVCSGAIKGRAGKNRAPANRKYRRRGHEIKPNSDS